MIFADRLRMLIDERNITQKQLAGDLQIPASTLGGYVQGTSEPDFETLKLLARYFHVTTDYLLDHQTDASQTSNENDLLRIFRTLSSEQQELYIEQGKAFLRIHAKEKAKSSRSILGKQNSVG